VLHDFVREALRSGAGKDAIAVALKEAGWPERDIDRALDQFADTGFAVPVPRPRGSVRARDAVFYGLMCVALVMAATSFVDLAHVLIDRWLDPDPVPPRSADWSVAQLLVFLPVYARLTQLDRRETAADPARRLSPVRQWVIAAALLAATLSLLATGVWVIYSLLQGGRDTAFFLKAVVTAAVAGAVLVTHLRAGALEDG